MKRRDILLKYVDTTLRGLEIAPYFNPTLRKSDGYDLQTLDVFDTETLRGLAKADSNIPDKGHLNIEPVDYVGDAGGLREIAEKAGMAGEFGYILSSHNFEHLPNPIKFLQGAETALRPGGTLALAIPDYRCCFDHFRFPTRLSDWLAAYHRDDKRPSAEMHFDGLVGFAVIADDETKPFHGNLAEPEPPAAALKHDIGAVYQRYLKRLETQGEYADIHCSVFFPEIFELLIRDLQYLGLINLEVIEIHPTLGAEFFAHLKKPDGISPRPPAQEHLRTRQRLLLSINRQLGSAAFGTVKAPVSHRYKRRFERAARLILGTRTVAAVQDWNLKRLARRRNRKPSR